MAMETKAGQYAESFGLQENATIGHGREFNDTLLQGAFRRIAQGAVKTREDFGTKVVNSGMQFTGVGQSKVPNEVTKQIVGQSLDVAGQVESSDSQFKLESMGRWMDILKHEDNYALQKQQLDAQEGDFLDVLGRVGAIVSAV